jgi:plastocyanin
MGRMSTWIAGASGRTLSAVVAAVFVIVGVIALIPLLAKPAPASREVVLVVRNMSFYLEGSDVPNPTLVAAPGEQLRVTIRNEEPGITHGFGVESISASIQDLHPGTTQSLSVQAPDRPGRYEYVCPPHAQMMRGVLQVVR